MKMPLGFDDFESTVPSALKLRKACQQVGIPKDKCESLMELIPDLCVGTGTAGKKTRRGSSKWQLCIKEQMQGKKWDPSRIKEAAKLYKAGKCPSIV